MKKRNPLVRLLAAIWSGVDGFRKILHLLLLLFIFVVFLGTLSGTAPMFPDRAALLIQPVELPLRAVHSPALSGSALLR